MENTVAITISLWKVAMPLKIKAFGWLVLHDKILTRAALLRCGIINLNACLCPMCNQVFETTAHLFLSCSFALQVWCLVGIWLHFPLPISNILELFSTLEHQGGFSG
jgi:hypothetical protein